MSSISDLVRFHLVSVYFGSVHCSGPLGLVRFYSVPFQFGSVLFYLILSIDVILARLMSARFGSVLPGLPNPPPKKSPERKKRPAIKVITEITQKKSLLQLHFQINHQLYSQVVEFNLRKQRWRNKMKQNPPIDN